MMYLRSDSLSIGITKEAYECSRNDCASVQYRVTIMKFRINDFKAIMDNWHEFEKIYSDITTKASPELTASLLQAGMATYDTNVKQMTASLQILGMTIGNELLPMLKSVTIGITEGVEWLNKHREETAKVIKYIGLFAEALILYRVQQLLATSALGKFVGTSTLVASTAPTFNAAIRSMGASIYSMGMTIGGALVKMAAFMAMAELMSRVSSGWLQDSAEKAFKISTAGAGSSDGMGASGRISDEDQAIMNAIEARDKFRADNSMAQAFGGVMYKNGDDLYKANALDKVVNDLLQAKEAKKGLDKVNAMVKLAEQKMPEKEQRNPYDRVEGQDLTKDKSNGGSSVPSYSENKLETKRYTENLFAILEKNKAEFQESLERLSTIFAIQGEDSVASMEARANLENQRMAQIKQEIAAIKAQESTLKARIAEEVAKYPELKPVIDAGKASGSDVSLPTWGDVDVEHVKPQIKTTAALLIEQINKELGVNAVVTSGYRAGDPGGHGKGDKLDIGWDGMQWGDQSFTRAVAMAESAGFKVYTVPHGTGAHLDVNGSGISENIVTNDLQRIDKSMTKELWDSMNQKDKTKWRIDNKEKIQANSVVSGILSDLDALTKMGLSESKDLVGLEEKRKREYLAGTQDPSKIYQRDIAGVKTKSELAKANAEKQNFFYDIDLAKIELNESTALQEIYARRIKEIKADITVFTKAENQNMVNSKTQELNQIQVLEAQNNSKIKSLESEKNTKIKEGLAGITQDVIVQGSSLKSIWGKLWSDLANDAIKALFKINGGTGGLLSQVFGMFNGSGGGGASNKNSGFNANKAGMGTDWLSVAKTVVPFFADGGITDKPSIFGEDGIEAAIPLSPNKRSRALGLYAETGKRLGIGTEVTASVSPRTMEKATEMSANAQYQQVSRDTVAEIQKSNALMTQQVNILMHLASNSGQGNTVTQPIVMKQSMSDGELASQLGRMKSQGYNV